MSASISTLTFLGHSSLLLDFDGYVVAIDPWLKGNPVCPKELQDPEKLDMIVLTHGHSDHAGDVLRLAAKHSPKTVCIVELAHALGADGIAGEVIGVNKGGTFTEGNVSITLVNAFHSNSFDSKTGKVYAGEACGVVVRYKEHTIYHAGDTCLFSDIKLIGDIYSPTVALFPIGDHYTMNPEHAALAASWVDAKISLPIHFGTFPILSGTADKFLLECSKRNVAARALEVGQTISL